MTQPPSLTTIIIFSIILTLLSPNIQVAATTAAEESTFAITTYAPNPKTSCLVGPYGWFCTPSSIEYSTVIYDVNTVYLGELYDPSSTSSSSSSSTGQVSCLAACTGSDALDVEACAETRFQATRATLLKDSDTAKAVVYEFYVNPFNGSDAGLGTREDPWETLERARERVRFLKAVCESAGLGRTLPAPLQIWVRENVTEAAAALGTIDPRSQLGNGRYAGITVSE